MIPCKKRKPFLTLAMGCLLFIMFISFGCGDSSDGGSGTESSSTFAYSYGGAESDYPESVQQTADSDYIVVGQTDSFGAGDTDAWVLKLDPNGTVVWEKAYGTTGGDAAQSFMETADGGYIVAGYTDPDGAWVFKLNADGTISWQKVYGDFKFYSIQQTTDGGYIAAGSTGAFGAGSNDVWIMKLNIDGTIAWQKAYGGTEEEASLSIQQTSDGGYIVAGGTCSFGVTCVCPAGNCTTDVWVFKLNADGTVVWQKTYGDPDVGDDELGAIVETLDGGYIVAGKTDFFGGGLTDGWILKLNIDGTIAWQKAYGSSLNDVLTYVQQTSDGGYIATGFTNSFGSNGLDAWILKLNADGTVEWEKAYGGTDTDWAQAISQTSDSGYIMAASTSSFSAGSDDIWILKLSSDGLVGFDPLSGAEVIDTTLTITDTTVVGVDTLATVTDTTATAVDTTATVTDTAATIEQQSP